VVASFAWGVAFHWPIRIGGPPVRRASFYLWNGVLSAGIFITWSFIRGKPFKCFGADGPVLTYVTGPIAFCIVHAVSFFSIVVFLRKFKRGDLDNYVKMYEE
jgi:hypothetical protein